MANTMMGNVWYLDLGSSFQMRGCREFFSALEEIDLHMYFELGDDEMYNATRIGKVTFKRELSSPLLLKDVMFVTS